MACSECPNLQELLKACGDFFSLKTYLSAVLDSLCEKGCAGRLTTLGLNPVSSPIAATAEGFPQLRGCECLLLVLQDTNGNIYLSMNKGQSWMVIPTFLDTISAVDPTADEDIDAGYSVGSRWINTTTGTEFVCVDATADAAIWAQVSNPLQGLTLIASGKLLADSPTIDITGIPQSYQDLILVLRARATNGVGSSDELYITFNGDDSGANYSSHNVEYVLSEVITVSHNQNFGRILGLNPSFGFTAGYFWALELIILGYYRDDISKQAQYLGTQFEPAGINHGEGFVAWENVTDGINQITLTFDDADIFPEGDFAAGSSWALYGRGLAL